MDEARKSGHAFPTVQEETAALIYNYEPICILFFILNQKKTFSVIYYIFDYSRHLQLY